LFVGGGPERRLGGKEKKNEWRGSDKKAVNYRERSRKPTRKISGKSSLRIIFFITFSYIDGDKNIFKSSK
jgi:hypothetical protein